MTGNTVNLDQIFGVLNLANTIINGDFSGFELVHYTETPSTDFTDALNESHFENQSRGMQFVILEWPTHTRVALYEGAELLAEVEYGSGGLMLEMLLNKLVSSPHP